MYEAIIHLQKRWWSWGWTTWTDLATRRTTTPTVYDTQATYTVYEYTYWTTKLYRTVYKTYTAWTDIFYSEASLENVVASRALNF